MASSGKNDARTLLLPLGVIVIVTVGTLGLAAFAVHKNFQGRIGLKLKDWVEIVYQGRQDTSTPESLPGPSPKN